MPPQSKCPKTIVNNIAPKKSIFKRQSKPPMKDTLTVLFEQMSLNEKTSEQDQHKSRRVTFAENIADVHMYECDEMPSRSISQMKEMIPKL